ncbi:MAG: sodium:calcium antiporter, partial [Planctomycetota bacterium]
MTLLGDAATFAAGAAALILGGEILVRGAVALAGRLGVSRLFIGLTVVAFGTSAPELALNLAAALNGHPQISFGNIIGSNIANIGLILGLSALLRPLVVQASLIRRELPLMLAATAGLIALAVAPPGAVVGGRTIAALSRLDAAALLTGFAGFLWMAARSLRRGAEGVLQAEIEEVMHSTPSMRLGGAWALTLVGLALLAGGGKLAETGAVGLAVGLGVSQAFVGLTIVAVSTSLPELAASLSAMRKGHSDIAVGNVVGSNLFNILLIMGLTAMVEPTTLPPGAWRALLAMAVLSAALVPI